MDCQGPEYGCSDRRWWAPLAGPMKINLPTSDRDHFWEKQPPTSTPFFAILVRLIFPPKTTSSLPKTVVIRLRRARLDRRGSEPDPDNRAGEVAGCAGDIPRVALVRFKPKAACSLE
jgi:hypothetical protein